MKVALRDGSVLASILSQAGLKLVDIGGRGSAFAPLACLAQFADYYVSEPDRQEAERLTRDLPSGAPWRTVTVLTEAIASRHGEADLYITDWPGMSSLLEPNTNVAARFYLGDMFRVVTVTKVPTLPLDEAASAYGFTDACFLKLDTQGTELDILSSGPLLLHSLLGVHTESLFHPFYKGQSLFADVDMYLRRHGFSLFSLSRTNLRRSGYRESLYSKRVIGWAHCLYLREPESLLAANRETLPRDLTRLLALALALGYFDIAFEILRVFRRLQLLPAEEVDQLADGVEGIAAKVTRRMVRKAQKRGLAEDVMAPNFRDRRHVE